MILVLLGSDNKLKACKSCNMCCHIINKYKLRKVLVYYNI